MTDAARRLVITFLDGALNCQWLLLPKPTVRWWERVKISSVYSWTNPQQYCCSLLKKHILIWHAPFLKKPLWNYEWLVGFHQAPGEYSSSNHTQIPPETKYEVGNVLFDKSNPSPKTKVVMENTKSGAMLQIKQDFSQRLHKASMIVFTNWQNAWKNLQRKFSSDIR